MVGGGIGGGGSLFGYVFGGGVKYSHGMEERFEAGLAVCVHDQLTVGEPKQNYL